MSRRPVGRTREAHRSPPARIGAAHHHDTGSGDEQDRSYSTEDEAEERGGIRSGPPVLSRRPGLDQLEGRNVVVEALRAQRHLTEILLDAGAAVKGVLTELLARAAQVQAPVQRVARSELDRTSLTGTHQGVIAWCRPMVEWTLPAFLEELGGGPPDPFLLLVDQVQYEQNLGAILRTAEAAGVHAVVVPRSHTTWVTPVVRRISAGATEHLPVIRASMMAALKELQRAGIPIVGADEEATVGFDEVDLTGPLALVMGGEHKGLSLPVRQRCERLVALPMHGRIGSLNVSVATAILLYEKVRQERARVRACPPA